MFMGEQHLILEWVFPRLRAVSVQLVGSGESGEGVVASVDVRERP
jgi:hypothetical protein